MNAKLAQRTFPRRFTLATVLLLTASAPAFPHRLDEYLQATILSIERDRLEAQITLTPGVAVSPYLVSFLDTNADGTISVPEQQAYAGRVLRDLSLKIDGHRLTPQLLSIHIPALEEMREGRGEIQLTFQAPLPTGRRSNRTLTFENHHQSPIAAYQVNCLVPRDPALRITAQKRDYSQSTYELDYTQTGSPSSSMSLTDPTGILFWLGAIPVLLALLARRWRERLGFA